MVLRLIESSRSRACRRELLEGPERGETAGNVDHHVQPPEMLQRHLHRERRNVGLGEVSRARPRVHALGGKLLDPLRDPDRVEVARHDLGAGLSESERDGVADLSRTADTRSPARPSRENRTASRS